MGKLVERYKELMLPIFLGLLIVTGFVIFMYHLQQIYKCYFGQSPAKEEEGNPMSYTFDDDSSRQFSFTGKADTKDKDEKKTQ